MTNLYQMLADAKTQGNSDGDYFQPNQQGAIIIHKLIYKTKGPKQSAILVGEILESNAKLAGATVQPPGVKVKKVYPLSKYEWVVDELKTDLIRIADVDEKTMTNAQVADMMKSAFEDNALCGVVANFTANEVKREGKTTLTKVFFAGAPGPTDKEGVPAEGHINHVSAIQARQAKLSGK